MSHDLRGRAYSLITLSLDVYSCSLVLLSYFLISDLTRYISSTRMYMFNDLNTLELCSTNVLWSKKEKERQTEREREKNCLIFASKSNTDEIPRVIQMDSPTGTSAASCTVVVGVPISEDDQLLREPPTHTYARATRFCL